MPKKMVTLYRFMSATSALNTIESMQLRIGRLATLNDPFDCAPHFVGQAGNEYERALCESMTSRLFYGRNEILGILSFTRTWKDPVLWSHYADSHRGMAVVVRRINGPDLWRVNYGSKRSNVQIRSVMDPAKVKEVTDAITETFNCKSTTWKYEKETRMVIQLDRCHIQGGHYYMKLENAALVGVILGLRCEHSSRLVKQLLVEKGLKHVKVWDAKKSESRFALERQEYSAFP